MQARSARYEQSKAQSAEFTRLVLGHLGRHDNSFNPVNFAVWYEFVAGNNTRLNQALAQMQAATPQVSDDMLAALYEDCIAEPAAQSVQDISLQLQTLMTDVQGSAERAGARAGAYGEQLGDLALAFSQQAASGIKPLVSRMIENTSVMSESTRMLVSEVAACRLEIGRLSDELSRALDDAQLDPLTQILNRKGFDDSLSAMMKTPLAKGRIHALMLFDIDRFKQVNDQYGHVMGDQVIKAVAEALQSCLAQTEPHGLARYGGEEYALVLPSCLMEDATELAEKIRQRAKAIRLRDRRTKDVTISITISGGIAIYKPSEQADTFIERADRALYQSKWAGRDRVTVG